MADYTNGAYYDPLLGYSAEGAARYFFEVNAPDALSALQPFYPTEKPGLDEALTEGIAFYYPTYVGATDSATFPSQCLPLDYSETPNQTIHKSAGGQIGVYGQSYTDRVLNIKLQNVTETKRVQLYKFIANCTKYAKNTFQYIDETGKLYTVRYVSGAWKPTMKGWPLWEVTVELYVISITDP